MSLFLLFLITSLVCAQESIPMSAIKHLTLHKGEMTTGRRISPRHQLICQGSWCARFEPQSVRCENRGVGANGLPRWECKAELNKQVRLGSVRVACEGYTRSGDPNVLAGSCGLTYQLYGTRSSTGPEFLWFVIAMFSVVGLGTACGCISPPPQRVQSDGDDPYWDDSDTYTDCSVGDSDSL